MIGHAHTHSRSADSARAQREASVIGWVDGVAVGRDRLDERIRALRSGRMAGRLPAAGSKEDRQFVRWIAHVLLTEEMCRLEARRLDLTAGVSRPLGRDEALYLGSINAAAWDECPEMAALLAAVVDAAPTVAVSMSMSASTPTCRWWRILHALAADEAVLAHQELRSLGWTTLRDLPSPLADALRQTPIGTRVGPVRSSLGWHIAIAVESELRLSDPTAVDSDAVRGGDRLREFNRWLDLRRRSLVTIADGFEHPGDPSQPDNTHRH
jgi:[acyl-carrier-protein] S-malonyltransferase